MSGRHSHGASGRAVALPLAPLHGPLSGTDRDARHLVAVDHPDRSSSFDTVPLVPVYLKVEPPAADAQVSTHVPIVALDGRCHEVARFRHPADAAWFLQRGDGPRTLPAAIATASRRTRVEQRDLLLDPALPLVVDDLAARFGGFLASLGVAIDDPHGAVRALRERGLGLVDPNRHRSWIDEQVFEGALYRGHLHCSRAEQAEARLDDRDGVSGEYDDGPVAPVPT